MGISLLFLFTLSFVIFDKRKVFIVYFLWNLFDPGIPIYGTYPNFVFGDFAALLLTLYAFAHNHYSSLLHEKKSFLWLIVIYHAITCIINEPSHVLYYTIVIFRGLAICYMSDFYIKEERDLLFLRNVLIVAIFCLFVISVNEAINMENPFMEWFDSAYGTSFNHLADIRFGLKRVQFFCRHATTFSFSSICLMSIVALLHHHYIGSRLIYILLSVLLLVCVFLSGTRSSMIPALIIFSTFIPIYKIRSTIIFCIIIVVLLICYVPFEYLNDVFTSFVDTESTSGSNVDMRKEQLAITYMLMSNNPLFGNGANTFSLYSDIISGAESCWFQIMIDFGLLGTLCLLMIYVNSIRMVIKKKQDVIFLSCILISIILVNTMTSLPGYNVEYFVYGVFIQTIILYQIIKNNKWK